MFKKKISSKTTPNSKGNGAAMMQQFGLDFGIPNFDDPNMDLGDVDDELEAELNALEPHSASKRKAPEAKKKPKGAPKQDLQSFHNDVNKLIHDIDRPINDDELSDGDEDELLAELNELNGDDVEEQLNAPASSTKVSFNVSEKNPLVSKLEERRTMYLKAIEKAKNASEISKMRRYDRQLKVVEEYIQNVRNGRMLDEKKVMEAVDAAAPPIPIGSISESNNLSSKLERKVDENLNQEPKSMNIQTSTPETFSNETVKQTTPKLPEKNNGTRSESSSKSVPQMGASTKSSSMESEMSDATASTKASQPKTVLEVLIIRHGELKKIHQQAVEKGEASKARRLDRQVKQYQEAIVATQKKQPYDYTELVELPGFPPIPGVKLAPPPAEVQVLLSSDVDAVHTSDSTPSIQQNPVRDRNLPHSVSSPVLQPKVRNESPAKGSIEDLKKQSKILIELVKEHNQKGKKQEAAKYFKMYKELKMKIESMEGSAVAPQIDEEPTVMTSGFEIVPSEKIFEGSLRMDSKQIVNRLQDDLRRQIQICARNEQLFNKMQGTVNTNIANGLKMLGQRSSKDLDRLKRLIEQENKMPIFHYEKRPMTLVNLNDDLNDEQVEVSVLRALNIGVPTGYTPSALETYVTIEFPELTNPAQTATTRRGTGAEIVDYPSPAHIFAIKRTDRQFSRGISRKEVKFSIYYRAGFLRADRLLGVASIPLASLSSTSTIHDSVHIYTDNHKRKPEGKLEVKIRIREPCGSEKQYETTNENWLFIDGVEDPVKSATISSPNAVNPTGSTISILTSLFSPGTVSNDLTGGLTTDDFDESRSTVKNTADSPATNRKIPKHSSELQGGELPPKKQTLPSSLKILESRKTNIDAIINKFGKSLPAERLTQFQKDKKIIEEEEKRIIDDFLERGSVAIDDYLKDLQVLLQHYEHELIENEKQNDKKQAEVSQERIEILKQEISSMTEKQHENSHEEVPMEEYTTEGF